MLALRGPTVSFCRLVCTTSACSSRKFDVKVEGNTTTVEVADVPEDTTRKLLKQNPHTCSFCTCNVPVKVRYSDVLILEQFMREDGTVLPQRITGLCKKMQLKIERCIMQAHWAGLFPDRTTADFDRSGYKRFQRYWDDDMDMYRLKIKEEKGTWYYIKRYRTVGGENAKY